MKIEYIREFTVLARYGSFKRAAEEMRITQGTLSKHIIQLEREIGQSLFRRGHSRSLLTEMGNKFLETALIITREYDRFAASNLASEPEVFTVGVSRDASVFIPRLIEIITPAEKSRLEFRTGTRDELIEWLNRGICRLCLSVLTQETAPEFGKSASIRKILQDEIAVVNTASNNYSLRAIAESGAFLSGPSPLYTALGSEYLNDEQITFDSPVQCGEFGVLSDLVMQGFGWAFVPKSVAERLAAVSSRVHFYLLPAQYRIHLFGLFHSEDSTADKMLRFIEESETPWN